MNEIESLVDWLMTEPSKEEAVMRYEETALAVTPENIEDLLPQKSILRGYIGDYAAIMAERRVFQGRTDDEERRRVLMLPLAWAAKAREESTRERDEDAKYHKTVRCAVLALVFLVLLNFILPFLRK